MTNKPKQEPKYDVLHTDRALIRLIALIPRVLWSAPVSALYLVMFALLLPTVIAVFFISAFLPLLWDVTTTPIGLIPLWFILAIGWPMVAAFMIFWLPLRLVKWSNDGKWYERFRERVALPPARQLERWLLRRFDQDKRKQKDTNTEIAETVATLVDAAPDGEHVDADAPMERTETL
ncbi:MAG: hypothetical protein AAF125_00215 [Chloroflexota bacterium]